MQLGTGHEVGKRQPETDEDRSRIKYLLKASAIQYLN
jgi:hypothetical protein